MSDSEKDLQIELKWPGVQGNSTHVRISLMDVRCADDLRIGYDYGRDGWVVSQAKVHEWEEDDKVRDHGWTEVAFVKAWALTPDMSEQAGRMG